MKWFTLYAKEWQLRALGKLLEYLVKDIPIERWSTPIVQRSGDRVVDDLAEIEVQGDFTANPTTSIREVEARKYWVACKFCTQSVSSTQNANFT